MFNRTRHWDPNNVVAGLQPNSALVFDACVAALRASYSAAQRGR
jgi:hypothetical protein